MYLFSCIESWLCHMESLIAVRGSFVLECWLQSTWASVVVAHRLRSTWAQKFWFMALVAPQHGWSYFSDYGLKLYDLEITTSPNHQHCQGSMIQDSQKQMILLLTSPQKVKRKRMLCHMAYIIHLTSFHHVGILSSHIITRRGVSTVQ